MVVAACLAFAALVVRFALAHWDSVYDDAFIYLRYVKNAHKCGLRWNCTDAPVEGFTGPLYLAILWLGSFATAQLIWLCQVVGTLCLIGAGSLAIVLAYQLAPTERTWVPPVCAAFVALVLGLDDFVTLNAVIGLETSLAALLVTLVVFAAVHERPKLLVTAACALVLVRPEGGVFLLALPVLPALRRWRFGAAAVGFLVVMTVIRYALFGQLAPNTFYAKSGGTAAHFVLGATYALDAIGDFPAILLAPLALYTRRRGVAYVLVATLLWFAFFLRSGGDTFEYSRLAFPLVPALLVFSACGIATRAGQLARPAVIVVGIALVVLPAARSIVRHAIPAQHANERVVQWAAIGSYLRAHYPRSTLIATVPIGAIGYYSNLPLLDLVGLTEPAIARAGRSVPPDMMTKAWIAHERNNTAYVLERAPTVIVTTMVRDHAWAALAETRAGFWSDWLLLQEIKAGRAPYHVRDIELGPTEHVLAFERN